MGVIPNHIAVGGGYESSFYLEVCFVLLIGRIPPTCMKGE